MLLLTLTTNKRDACLVQMVAFHAVLAMNVLSAAQNSIIILQVSFVSKYVVMVRDLHLLVMTEIILMVMVAQRTAMFKVDIIVLVDHQIQKILVHHLSLLL